MKKTELKSDFPCVYSINGVLHEDGEVNFEENGVYFATVLPLDAVYLPYTVKFVGTTPQTNKDLCACVSTSKTNYLLFSKRYNYLYSPTAFSKPSDGVCSFFYDIKEGRIQKSKEYLSESLLGAVSEDKLCDFFAKYDCIVKLASNEYLLSNKNGEGDIFCFSLKNGLIDDIYNE